jgi:hypothetical protein
MNWSLITYGAYDYAADARGYTILGVGELDWDNWAFRAGRAMEPTVANGRSLDYNIFQRHGDQIEVQHDHEVHGLPGSVSVLVYRNVANAGNYAQAVALAQATGTIPDITAHRYLEAKDGYGLRAAGVLFAIALIDACIIGASAVSLSTAYAIGDVLSLRHSLHRKPTDAKGFYAVYFGLIAISAALVLTPGTPLGLLTNAVQTLAGVLLPGATVFLLLLCNDKAVLGPWANTFKINLFTGAVIAVLVMLSVILTASVLFPDISGNQILAVLGGGSSLAVVVTIAILLWQRRRGIAVAATPAAPLSERATWRMPPLALLPRAELTVLNRAFPTNPKSASCLRADAGRDPFHSTGVCAGCPGSGVASAGYARAASRARCVGGENRRYPSTNG